ncbi:2-hydroxyacid dehydrogenase [Stakelama saccharophila]|uniref:D-glycerate dehydrogenase n=1 Tax=Stakelama saccharophila TaxID=3075605 RepID=A0ABZ0B4U3_9SPHN|nr:D-glycerate dehydrogenase [Stakelama sp. W311]WNO52402.1 D-glycerate dehydrogenase [Stakelama sp. W311]
MTAMPKLLVTRRLPEPVEAHLAERYETTLNPGDTPLDRAALADAMTRYDAILPTITDRIDTDILTTRGACVKILANYGAGFEHIDLDAARAAGIAVTNTPDVLTDATAELAITLMLMAARRAGEGERELRRGDWTGWRPTHMIGRSIEGKTLGLVGFGRIAQATAKRARDGFGMTIRYYSRSRAPAKIEDALDARCADDLEALAAEADILSLHTPGGAATHHLIDAALIARMPRHAILVNTARGPVVDEQALAAALAEGRIAGAGLDVYEDEPRVHPLLAAQERAVLLPHLGSATIESRTAMGMRAADNLHAFFAGRALPDRVA